MHPPSHPYNHQPDPTGPTCWTADCKVEPGAGTSRARRMVEVWSGLAVGVEWCVRGSWCSARTLGSVSGTDVPLGWYGRPKAKRTSGRVCT